MPDKFSNKTPDPRRPARRTSLLWYVPGAVLICLGAFIWLAPRDRFDREIRSSDGCVKQLSDETGIADQLRFQETSTGFFDKGHIHSMNSTLDFLRFPVLGWFDRFRLGLTVLRAHHPNIDAAERGAAAEPGGETSSPRRA